VSGYRQPVRTWAPPERGPYTELQALASAFDAPYAGAATLEAEAHGMRLSIGLLFDSGVVEGASFRVTGRTWPRVVLRRETEEDRVAKTEGLTRELQTGDAAFDEKVFVASDAPELDLRRLLESAERRSAVLSLLAFGERVVFAEDGIHARVHERHALEPDWVQQHVLPHLRTLADGPPLSAEEGRTPHERLERTLLALGVAALVSTFVGWTGLGTTGLLDAGRFWLGLLGGGFGLLLLFPAVRVLRWIVRGHSRAHDQFPVGAASLFLILTGWGSLLPMVLNATVDGEPRRPVKGVVTSIGGGDDASVVAHVRWDDGSNDDEIVVLRPLAKVGDRVRAVQRRGLLGWRWEQRGDAFVER
jgi:hypothetical protein